MRDDVERVWRDEWGRVLALLVAQFRRLDLAEDALAEAFEVAARTWPEAGTPRNPAAWLLTSARRRALDRLRAEAVAARKHPLLVVDAEVEHRAHAVRADPGDLVPDERLRLVLLCAHPALAPDAAAALSLRLVLGVSTEDIGLLFLTSTSTMAARITRAKRKVVQAGIPLRVPDGIDLDDRVQVVASVAYLVFTAGYAPRTGPDALRVDRAAEGIRLVRLVDELLPGRAQVQSLLALMLLQHSRRDARRDQDGVPVLLPVQDRSRWHRDEIDEGLRLLATASAADPPPVGEGRSYLLQARIAAEHASAATAGDTRWDRIASTYADLEEHTGSAVVRLNRAVAVAEHAGPQAGLLLLDGLEERLPGHHRVPATRAALLARLGEVARAVEEYDAAIALCGNEAERDQLARLRAALASG